MDTKSPQTKTREQVLQDQGKFMMPSKFNVLFLVLNQDKEPQVLQYRKIMVGNEKLSGEFNQFIGYTCCESSVITGAAKLLTKITGGVLTPSNQKLILEEQTTKEELEEISIDPEYKNAKPEKKYTPALSEYTNMILYDAFQFQDHEKDCITYITRVENLNFKLVNEYLLKNQIMVEFSLFPLEINPENKMSQNWKNVDDSVLRFIKEEKILKQLTQNKSEENVTSPLSEDIINATTTTTTTKSQSLPQYILLICQPGLKTPMMNALYFSFFKKYGEKWKIYNAPTGILPSLEELQQARGLIIPGGALDAWQTDVEWLNKVRELIRYTYQSCKNTKLLGICFGAQIICQSLGGTVEKMDCEYIRRGEALSVLNNAFYELDFVQKAQISKEKILVVAQAHQNEMVKLPEGAMKCADSQSCQCEIYAIGNKVLGFQGHPEYNEIFQAGANFRLNRCNTSKSYEECEKEFCCYAYKMPITQHETTKICYYFLKQDMLKKE